MLLTSRSIAHKTSFPLAIFSFSSHSIQYGLGSASDYYAFDQLVGSSNFDTSYAYNLKDHGNVNSYPLYHTSYEVFSMMKKFIDPDFAVNRLLLRLFYMIDMDFVSQAHRTMAQFVGVLALLISETPVLQFNVSRYATVLQQTAKSIPQNDTYFRTNNVFALIS